MKTKYIALLFLLPLPVSAADWYVATDGDDANDGSEAAPYATIQHAIDQAAAGDTVIVRGGVYDQGGEPLTIWRENLTLKSHPDELAHVRANNSGDVPFAAVYFEEDNCDGSAIEGLEISGGNYAVMVGSSWNNVDHDDSPDESLTCDDITIAGNHIHGSVRDTIKLPAGVRNISILRNEISDSGIHGSTNAECIDAVNVLGLHVAGNYMLYCATNGIYAKGGSRDVVIEQNLVTDVGQSGTPSAGIILGYTDTDYIVFDLANNPDLYESIDGTVRNNIVINTPGAGIAAWASLNARIHNNTLIDVANEAQGGILLSEGTVCEQPVASEDCTLSDDERHRQTNRNTQVFNNIVVSGGGQVFEVRENGLDADSDFAFDNNWYHHPDGEILFEWDGTSDLSLAEWQSEPFGGQDTHSGSGDPMLDANFHLSADSAGLINMGAFVETVDQDYDGLLRDDGSLDIGADEFDNGGVLTVPPDANSFGTGIGSLMPPDEDDTGNGGSGDSGGGGGDSGDDDEDETDDGGETGNDGQQPESGSGGGSFGFLLTLSLLLRGRRMR